MEIRCFYSHNLLVNNNYCTTYLVYCVTNFSLFFFSVENVTVDSLTTKYKESCERHSASPIHSVLNQIRKLNPNLDRNECLDLKGVYLNNVDWESLEEIFKRIQFKNINVEATGLNDDVRHQKDENSFITLNFHTNKMLNIKWFWNQYTTIIVLLVVLTIN